MTNEDKIKEIAVSYCDDDDYENVERIIIEDALEEFSEWRDNQLREIRSHQIERFNKYHDKNLNKNVMNQAAGAIFIIDHILGEDSRKEMHCAFTTMD